MLFFRSHRIPNVYYIILYYTDLGVSDGIFISESNNRGYFIIIHYTAVVFV